MLSICFDVRHRPYTTSHLFLSPSFPLSLPSLSSLPSPSPTHTRTLGIPYTNHSLEDMLLMKSAIQAGLPRTSGIVIYHNVNRDLQMDLKVIKKWQRRFAAMDGDKDGFIKVEDFASFLQLPQDACVQAVFTAADKV